MHYPIKTLNYSENYTMKLTFCLVATCPIASSPEAIDMNSIHVCQMYLYTHNDTRTMS